MPAGSERPLPTPVRYGLPFLLVGATLGLKALLDLMIGGSTWPFLLLIFPIILTAWIAGLGPGLVATVLAASAGAWSFLPAAPDLGIRDLLRLSVFVAEGSVISFLCDLRLRAAQQLFAQRKWFQVTIGSVGDGVIATDMDGRVTLLNATAERLTGWTEKEALGRPLGDVFRVADAGTKDVAASLVTRALEQGVVVRLASCRIATRGGDEVEIEDSVAPIRGDDGKFLGVVLVFRDASEKRAVEEALRQSESHFRMLADAAPVMVWTSGTDARCDWFNRHWLEFTGRTLDEEVGEGWTEGVHPEDLERCVGTYLAAFGRREPFLMDDRLRRHDHEYRWILDHGTARFAADGEFVGYIGSCIDITDHQRAARRQAAHTPSVRRWPKRGRSRPSRPRCSRSCAATSNGTSAPSGPWTGLAACSAASSLARALAALSGVRGHEPARGAASGSGPSRAGLEDRHARLDPRRDGGVPVAAGAGGA